MKFIISAALFVILGINVEAGTTIKTEMGYTCAFPFESEGITYTDKCAPGEQPWCALDDTGNWDYCILDLAPTPKPKPPPNFDPNNIKKIYTIKGDLCYLPFDYRGETYYDKCANAASNRTWCYTSADQSDWSYCVNFNAIKTQPFVYTPLDESARPVPQSCNRSKTTWTAAQKKTIVDLHNAARADAGATFILKMSWSNQLAERAQYFTDQCPDYHAESKNCFGDDLGQNLVVHYAVNIHPDVDLATDIGASWGTNEKVNFDAVNNKCAKDTVCGHYTQLTWKNSYEVGCGITKCTKHGTKWPYRTVFACDYNFAGNYYNYPPFKYGTPCSECKDGLYPYDYKCVDGKFCEACKTGDSSCTKQDVCRDVNPKGNCDTAVVKLCTNLDLLTEVESLYLSMMVNCRKSCGLCRAPEIFRNGYKA